MSQTPHSPPLQASLMARIARNSGIMFFAVIVGKLLSFGVQVMVTRLFGPKYFGILILGLSVVELIRILCSLGLPKGGMRFVSFYLGEGTHERIPGVMTIAFAYPFGISLLVCAGLFAGAPFLATLWFHDPELIPILKALAFSIPFSTVMGVGVDLSRGFNTTVFAAVTENLAKPFFNLVFFFLFLAAGLGFEAIVVAIIVSSAAAAILILFCLRFLVQNRIGAPLTNGSGRTRRLEWKEQRKILAYSLPLFLTGITGIVLHYADVLMLGYFLESGPVGIYAAASVVATMLSSVLVLSLNSIFAPMIATEFGRCNHGNIRFLYRSTTRWMLLIVMPSVVFMIIARDAIMRIYGPEFMVQGPVVLVILLTGHAVNCLTGGVGNILSMTGHQHKELYTNLFAVLINVLLNAVLIPRFGLLGAATATMASQIVVNLIRVRLVHGIFQVQPFSGRMLAVIGLASLLCWAIGLFSGPGGNLLGQTALALTAALVTAGLIFTICLTPEDRALLNRIRARFTPAGSGA